MVLENILSPSHVREHPSTSFWLGIFYAAVAVILAYFIFPDEPSLSIIFLTTLAALPLLINVLTLEEEEEMTAIKITKKIPLIKSHKDVMMVFTLMFFGFLALFIVTYIFSPEKISNLFFSKQIKTITSIVGPSSIQGAFTAEDSLKIILLNNFKVLLFAILFSFLYGAGAIFILAWNASILAVAMGNFIKRQIANFGGGIFSYFKASSLGVARYMIHGLPEVAGYFLGAIAGGIISAAVVKSDYKDPRFYEVVMDSFDLIALAILMLIIGALLEVSVTPLLFS